MSGSGVRSWRGLSLVAGEAAGDGLVLAEPLSFWGGFDPETGAITDHHHPQHGVVLTGRVVFMAAGRGSSSASSVLAEAIRKGTAPAAVVLGAPDEIIALGAIVADELYGRTMPVVVGGPECIREASGAVSDAVATPSPVRVLSDGTVSVT